MSLSVQKLRGNPATALGFVTVPTPGTPVNLMVNLDANNNNAPGTPNPPPGAFPSTKTEYSPNCRGFSVQGYQPGNNNNGMIPNTGNIYLLMFPSPGGSGNLTDTGCMLKVIGPTEDFFFPPDGRGQEMFSLYNYRLDADVAGEGGLITAWGGGLA